MFQKILTFITTILQRATEQDIQTNEYLAQRGISVQQSSTMFTSAAVLFTMMIVITGPILFCIYLATRYPAEEEVLMIVAFSLTVLFFVVPLVGAVLWLIFKQIKKLF